MEPRDRSHCESTPSPYPEHVAAPPSSLSTFHSGPRRQGFVAPLKTGAPLTAPGRPSLDGNGAPGSGLFGEVDFEVRVIRAQ
jgi:hypothetical protein